VDDHKKAGFKDIGPGGVKCPCCNFHDKKTNMLNKVSRRRLKRKLLKEIDNLPSGVIDGR